MEKEQNANDMADKVRNQIQLKELLVDFPSDIDYYQSKRKSVLI